VARPKKVLGAESKLYQALDSAWRRWLRPDGALLMSERQWVRAREGEVYTRYNWRSGRLDVATVSIKPAYQGRGILRAVMGLATSLPVLRVRLESITNPRLMAGARTWKFPGRRREVVDEHELCVTVEWVVHGG